MSSSQLLRMRVNERLEAAVEEIFGLVEKTITEYEEEAVRSKREIGQLKQKLEQLVFLRPEVILTRADSQLVSEEWPPSLQQYETKAEGIPVLIQRLGPDMEVDTCNRAEVRREIDHLKQHVELLAVLKAEVTSLKADTQELFPSQQPDCLVTKEEVKTHDLKQIREEEEEMSISPDMEADAFNVDEVRDPDSEPDEYCEPLSSSVAESMDGDERTEMDRSSSPLQSRSAELEQPPRGDKSCRLCGEIFWKDSSLIRHVALSHKGHKAFRCLHCNKEFEQRYRLVTHMRVHTGEKPFSCYFCSKTFAWKRYLPVHMKRHFGVTTAENPSVGVSLTKESLANRSVLITCGNTMERNLIHLCEKCGKMFTSRSYWARHAERCTGTQNTTDLAVQHVAEPFTQQLPVQEREEERNSQLWEKTSE